MQEEVIITPVTPVSERGLEVDLKTTRSIQWKMSLLFVALFLLVTLSVGATYWGIQVQREDALLINLAGRQRMLTQKMAWLALAQPGSQELAEAVRLFDQTMQALRTGGETQYSLPESSGDAQSASSVYLPPAPNPQIRSDLDQAASLWESFRSHLEPADSNALQAESPALLAKLDEIVQEYETLARARLRRVQIIQAVSLAAGLVLVLWGYTLTRRSILQPLVTLRSAAQRITQGELTEPVPSLGEDELGELGRAFDAMRAEVAAVQGELEERVAQRTRELALAFEFSQEIVSQLDQEHLMQSVIERARSLTNSSAVSLCLLDQDSTSLALAASSGDGRDHTGLVQSLERDPAYQVITTGETVTVQADCTRCRFLLDRAPGACAVAPLRTGNTTLGALCVVRPPEQSFDADETRALTLLANTATIAIANARLVESGRRQAEQAAIHTERERLAAELHDNLAQTLGFVNMKIDQINKELADDRRQESLTDLAAIKSAIGGAYGEVRSALVGLKQQEPGAGDFRQTLATSIDGIRKVSDLEIHLECDAGEDLPLPRLAQLQAIQILREALSNASRHARVQQVWVRLAQKPECMELTIEDDGAGFDPQAVIGGDHMGLRLMHERAERSGGSLVVESSPNSGTRIILRYPLEPPK